MADYVELLAECDRREQVIINLQQVLITQTSNLNKAVKALQAMADIQLSLTKMRWTQDKPTVEGWYWAERDMAGLPGVTMVFVTKIDKSYTHVWSPNERKEYGTADFDWWCGPLTYPYLLQFAEQVNA